MRVPAVLTAVAALSLPATARAVDPFEIQVYDGTADAPGAAGLEVHTNVVASGPQTRGGGERDTAGESHLTLEPSYGVLPFWEVGAYLQTALRPDGAYDWAGGKLRSKLVTPVGWRPHLRLGLNVEVAYLPAFYDADRLGAEARPIVAWEDAGWLLAANPILDIGLRGAGWRDGPALEPCVAVKRKLPLGGGAAGADAPVLAVGVEYYAGLGPLAGPLPWREQEHTVFETLDLSWGALDLNLGVGEGLTAVSPALLVKLIAGYGFGAVR